MMMNKVKSPTMTIAKYFLTVPLFLIFITANTIFAAQNEDKSLAIGIIQENIQEVEQPVQPSINLPEPPPEKVTDEIFVVVEKQPEYQGGKDALFKFLADNIKYPVIAQENGIQGRVVCNFVVKKDGSIGDVSVLHSVDPSLDAEVMRIIKAMSKWKPGTQKGSPVDVKVILPAVFRLQGGGSQKDVHKNIDLSAFPEGILILDELVIVGYGVQQPVDQDKKKTLGNDEVFVVVENQPVYPGGAGAMMKFLADNVKYPVESMQKGIQGRVICNFIIMKDGSIDSVSVVRGVDPLLDAEAVRVIKLMPKWEPGKQRGQAVNVRFTLPVVFRLNIDEPTEQEKKASQEKSENYEKAEFPGGEEAFMKYLAATVKYPVIAQENGIQGLVSAVYTINSTGKVSFVRFDKAVDPSLDKEVKRVIESMPDWKPAKMNDAATDMTTVTHFVFRIQGDGIQPYNGEVPKDAVIVVGFGAQKKQ